MKQILAAFSFFTRLPFWRLADIPKECYERVVPLWPMVGWLTGGLMYLTFWGGSYVLPTGVCVMLALLVRVLVTGALHEDGFADFCDGFGGGTTRERTLEIMKDSHIGTYGVLGLIIYYLLISNLLCDLISQSISLFIIVADTFCKYLASTIIYSLPYARKENEAKNKLIYSQVSLSEKCFSFLIGIMPFLCVLTLVLCGHMELINIMTLFIAMLVSIITSRILFRFMHIRIQGYTGDCCGATFIILETVFYLTVVCTNSILTNP